MKKKVIVIGATGTIGKAIVANLEADCDLIQVGSRSGDYQVDITSTASIRDLYKKFSDADALVCAAAGNIAFKPLADMTKEDYAQSMQGKMLGQIDLVLEGLKLLKDSASFALTTGLLNYDPIVSGTAAAALNGAVEGFVRAAAIDVPARQRINVVSPTLLVESVDVYRDFFPGFSVVPAAVVANAYRKAIFGAQTGQVIRVGW